MSSKDCNPAGTPGSVTSSSKVPSISLKSVAVYSSGIRSCLPTNYSTSSCRPNISLTNSCHSNICLQTPSQTTFSLSAPCQPSNRPINNCLPPTCLPPPCVPPACIPFPARAINCYLGGSYFSYTEGIFNGNGKETMQFLNDRLACYLQKVKSLEKENADLECKIQEWHENQTPYECTDFNRCYRTIEELQQQICCTKADNARLCLDIDNLKATSDDYSIKTDYEKGLRQSAETDINGLRKVLDDLTLCKADLEAQLESLTGQILCLKKNHEEVANPLRSQLGNRVNVEVDAGPSCNLNKVLEEIRCQYETLVEKNRCEVENWYHAQMQELNKEVVSSGEQLQCSQTEIIQLKYTVQTLEIDLQSQHNMNSTLESTLAETETRHSNQIAELQCLISNVEAQLAELRSDIERQNCEYKVLLDAKCQLDREINAYRKLLEGGDCKLCIPQMTAS